MGFAVMEILRSGKLEDICNTSEGLLTCYLHLPKTALKDTFYKQLETALMHVQNTQYILGDFNAKIGNKSLLLFPAQTQRIHKGVPGP